MKVELKYCAMWNYEPQAVSLTSKLLETHKQKITGMTLIPSKGGCFELSVGNELIFSKLKDGKFPDEKWAVDAVGQRLK